MRDKTRAVVMVHVIGMVATACGAATGRSGGSGGTPLTTIGMAELARPVVMQAADVSWTRPVATLLGEDGARNTACETRTTEEPIAAFRLVEPVDDLTITVDQDGGYTQFLLVGPDAVWQQCNGATLAAPAVTWTAGEYRVYPTRGTEPFTVTVTSPRLAAANAPVPAGPPALVVASQGVSTLEVVQHEDRQYSTDIVLQTEGSLKVQLRVLVEGKEVPMRFAQCGLEAEARCDAIPGTTGSPTTTLPGSRRIRITGWSGNYVPSRMTVQTLVDRDHIPMEELIVGAPTSETPLEQRDLARYGVDGRRWRPSWSNIAHAFEVLPAGFVVFARKDFAGDLAGVPTTIQAGEPLFMFEQHFVRANGESVSFRFDGPMHDVLPTLVTATWPTTIVMPAPVPPEAKSEVSMYHYPYGDDASDVSFLDDPRVAAFMKAREPVKACIGRELEKRGSGFGYDIATYNRDGTLQKVESLTKHIEDEVYKVCKVAKLDAQRAKLRLALRAEMLAKVKAVIEAR